MREHLQRLKNAHTVGKKGHSMADCRKRVANDIQQSANGRGSGRHWDVESAFIMEPMLIQHDAQPRCQRCGGAHFVSSCKNAQKCDHHPVASRKSRSRGENARRAVRNSMDGAAHTRGVSVAQKKHQSLFCGACAKYGHTRAQCESQCAACGSSVHRLKDCPVGRAARPPPGNRQPPRHSITNPYRCEIYVCHETTTRATPPDAPDAPATTPVMDEKTEPQQSTPDVGMPWIQQMRCFLPPAAMDLLLLEGQQVSDSAPQGQGGRQAYPHGPQESLRRSRQTATTNLWGRRSLLKMQNSTGASRWKVSTQLS